MPDVWYYDATDSPKHEDAETVYPTPDHPELQGAGIVRQMHTVPSGVEKCGGDDSDSDEFDHGAFADQHWKTRVSQIESGKVDDHLATIIEQTQSETVKDAARARQTRRDAAE